MQGRKQKIHKLRQITRQLSPSVFTSVLSRWVQASLGSSLAVAYCSEGVVFTANDGTSLLGWTSPSQLERTVDARQRLIHRLLYGQKRSLSIDLASPTSNAPGWLIHNHPSTHLHPSTVQPLRYTSNPVTSNPKFSNGRVWV